ncbi:feline leukemia virus subgroup C receptor-related protein 1-like [Coccinella septempunctata]|uniref:feline leukemia virus subgroup C receptor-related protein 1-like n=1 Tax=Coccinella septempunctata TaxID=41139 RepID=UPI001D08EC55|nr:feline leukemia virus subgroup C receptor-related protein 1-like [Coccinella septempunctata]
MFSSENTPLKAKDQSTIALDPYRWIILLIFATYCCVNFFLIFQFTIIANITERYYNVGSVTCDATGLVFMFSYIVFAIPVGRFIEQHDLKVVSIVSTGLTAAGNLLKFLALSPDRFYIILISQCICGVAQVFMMGLPPKVACVWFGPKEVSIACGVGIVGLQLGMAIGSALPTYLVPDTLNNEQVAAGFLKMFTLDNVASVLIFIIVLLFFRSEPEFPPSLSQAAKHEEETKTVDKEMLGKYFKNKDFLLILYCFGTAWGLWNSIGFTINEVFLHYIPNVGNIIGLLLMGSILAGGVFGSMIFGFVLDKTHEFKKLTLFLMTMNCLSWFIFTFFLQKRCLGASCAFFLIAGFFGGSLAVTAFEYTTEVLYPLPEALGTTIFSVSIYLFSIIYTLLSEYIFLRFGFLAGQIAIGIGFGTTAFGSIFITSKYKRREANISGSLYETREIME